MKTFIDNKGREWKLEINVATVKRVKTLIGTNLLEAVHGDLIKDVTGDPVLLVDLLYCICKVQADAAGVTDEEFGAGLAGDSIQAATDAFLDELIDFFPLGKRQILRRAWTRLQEAETKAQAAAVHYLNGPKLDAIIEKELKSITG